MVTRYVNNCTLVTVLLSIVVASGARVETGNHDGFPTGVPERSLLVDDLGHNTNVAFSMWVPGWYMSGTAWDQAVSKISHRNPEATYHGQDEEDKYAFESFFYTTKNGIYLEMGALDGVTYSNTLYLHEAHGWRGLLIEANPTSYAELIKNRPDDVCLHVAVCASSSVVHFVSTGHFATTGIFEFMPAAFIQDWHPGLEVASLPTVQCHPLDTILAKVGIREIDFWSLDVEGGELEVLRSINFDVIKVGVFAIEALDINTPKHKELVDLLLSKGYTYHGHMVRNDWFLGPDFVPVSKASVHHNADGHAVHKHTLGPSNH